MLDPSEIIGVDISSFTINCYRFNSSRSLIANILEKTPRYTMPGATTIILSEIINHIDPVSQCSLVFVAIPGEVDPFGRFVITSEEMDGWSDVPLADWLEPRVHRQVIVLNRTKAFSDFDDPEFSRNFSSKEIILNFCNS